MKILILDGLIEDTETGNKTKTLLKRKLEGKDIEIIVLRNLKINYCLGCFECWVKTPGICRFKDDGNMIAEKFIQSDITIYLTDISFGGYSSELKRALDRVIGLILPFFRQINGETHHQMRYEKYPDIFSIGFLNEVDRESEDIFRQLVKRNALNFNPRRYNSEIVYDNDNDEEIKSKINNLINSGE